MPKERSDATKLLIVKSELGARNRMYDELRHEMMHWKDRALAAERLSSDWQKRFDALVSRDTAMANAMGK